MNPLPWSTAVAYVLVARTGLTLLKPEGVAVMWPALGLAVGGLIALGADARAPVATGLCLGIIAARLRTGGNFWLAIALGLCNTGGALLTTRLIERWFGPAFKLENVSCVLGFLGAIAVGTLAAAVKWDRGGSDHRFNGGHLDRLARLVHICRARHRHGGPAANRARVSHAPGAAQA